MILINSIHKRQDPPRENAAVTPSGVRPYVDTLSSQFVIERKPIVMTALLSPRDKFYTYLMYVLSSSKKAGKYLCEKTKRKLFPSASKSLQSKDQPEHEQLTAAAV